MIFVNCMEFCHFHIDKKADFNDTQHRYKTGPYPYSTQNGQGLKRLL